ncbi:MAG: double zinc ribbon domain-containing protein [Methanobacterium sp.]
MPYLICEKCKGYYALQAGESPEDFDKCKCGGSLRYVKKLHKRYNQEKSLIKLNICPNCGNQNIKTSKICVFCGKMLKSSNAPNICLNCGKENVKTSQVCVFCSRSLKSNQAKRINWNPIGYGALVLILIIFLFLILS